MTIEFTEEDMAIMLETTMADGRLSTSNYCKHFTLCSKCDGFSSVAHAGLKCSECGADMQNCDDWTLFNVLKRAKSKSKHWNPTWWLPAHIASYLNKRKGQDWIEAYKWAQLLENVEKHQKWFFAYRDKKA